MKTGSIVVRKEAGINSYIVGCKFSKGYYFLLTKAEELIVT